MLLKPMELVFKAHFSNFLEKILFHYTYVKENTAQSIKIGIVTPINLF